MTKLTDLTPEQQANEIRQKQMYLGIYLLRFIRSEITASEPGMLSEEIIVEMSKPSGLTDESQRQAYLDYKAHGIDVVKGKFKRGEYS